jgi:D-alanine-D-alanine ligase
MIGVIYGGNSLEHEISIKSGKAAANEIGAKEFYLKKDGSWEVNGEKVDNIVPYLKDMEIVIPLCHGSPGEDGNLQGFLKINQIPYTGCDVASSAVCMDKDFTKRILQSHGIETTPFQTFFSLKQALDADIFLPCMVKASSLGSSFGIYKVTKNLKQALEKAFSLSSKILVEKVIKGREIWCSVLEKDGKVVVSTPCEMIPEGGFFSYKEKYTKASKTIYHVPAIDVPAQEIKEIAAKTFEVLGCLGFARVDFFLTEDLKILVNEVNNIPGFTPTSLFPKALLYDGISYKEIILALIESVKNKKELLLKV